MYRKVEYVFEHRVLVNRSKMGHWNFIFILSSSFLTKQSLTERSNLGKLINWMHFSVLKPLNWFFQFLWKEKTCLLSAVSIWHENFEERIYIRTQKQLFRVFSPLLKEFLNKGTKKVQKTQCNSQYGVSLRDFYTRCSPQIKDTFFLFTKIQENQFEVFKTQKFIQFFKFHTFLKET